MGRGAGHPESQTLALDPLDGRLKAAHGELGRESVNVEQVLNEFKKSGARSIGQASAAKPSPVRPN